MCYSSVISLKVRPKHDKHIIGTLDYTLKHSYVRRRLYTYSTWFVQFSFNADFTVSIPRGGGGA